jgi:hypothetical protein
MIKQKTQRLERWAFLMICQNQTKQ